MKKLFTIILALMILAGTSFAATLPASLKKIVPFDVLSKETRWNFDLLEYSQRQLYNGNASLEVDYIDAQMVSVLTLEADTVSEKTAGSGVTIDSVLLKDNSIKAGGTEQLKFWTYKHFLTSGEITNGYCNVTVTAVILANIRGIPAVGYDASLVRVYARSDIIKARLSSTTNVHIIFNNAELDSTSDYVAFTIIEAQ